MTRPEHCAHGAHRPTYVCIFEHNIPQHFSQFWQHGPCVAGGSRSAYHVVVTSGVAASFYRIIIPHLGHLFELFRCVRESEHGHFWRDVTLITILFRTAFRTCCNGIRLAQAAQPHVQKTVVISTHFLTMKLSMLTLVSVAGAVHVGLRSTQSICISSDRSRRAILQTKLAVLGVPCEGMCRDVGSYPNCDCSGFDGREVSSDDTRACFERLCGPTRPCPSEQFVSCVKACTNTLRAPVGIAAPEPRSVGQARCCAMEGEGRTRGDVGRNFHGLVR